MFAASAELYDPLYRAFKDFAAEAAAVAQFIREHSPCAHSVLDIGCGTGEHAKHLSDTFGFRVDGLDLDPGLLSVAKAKMPNATFFEADMSEFDLKRQYDVILCLFSSIGYVRSLERVTATLDCFRRHLHPGGLILVEPWFAPGVLTAGPGTDRVALLGDLSVTRKAFTRIDGRMSTLQFTYYISEHGTRRTVSEEHTLGLFTQAEMLQSFEQADLPVRYLEPGLTGRGLYLAQAREKSRTTQE